MRSPLLTALALVIALPAAANQIVLYDRQNFSGRSLTVDRQQPNLAYQGFENRASSVYVLEGTWEFCTQPYFQGNCRVYSPGEYRSLGGQQNRISSVRPVRSGGGGGDGDGWSPGAAEAELYDGQNFQGRIGTLRGPTPNFEPLGLNDRVASLIIRRGTWEFCTDANYRNNCRVYSPGEYAQIWGGQDDKYSSARPVSGGWGSGGSSGGIPGGGWGGGSSGGAPRIRLFEYPNFGGRSIWLRDAIDNFEQINFNDKAESMIVEGGEWRLCSDANGQGNCQTFRPGQYPILPGGLRNSVSSAYRR
ncbi:MAG: beta/gamma crystallin family protein [Betaproteobacteria bacterium]|nr:beta/gamma crystallin family protein [Betaproteobacteria bacterium]